MYKAGHQQSVPLPGSELRVYSSVADKFHSKWWHGLAVEQATSANYRCTCIVNSGGGERRHVAKSKCAWWTICMLAPAFLLPH